MESPDKIIVAPHQITDYDLDLQEVGHNGAQEYIRKDALLEFINEKLQESVDRLDFRTNKAYAEVLDKLNNF